MKISKEISCEKRRNSYDFVVKHVERVVFFWDMTPYRQVVGYRLFESDNGLLFNRLNVQEEKFFLKISTFKDKAATLPRKFGIRLPLTQSYPRRT